MSVNFTVAWPLLLLLLLLVSLPQASIRDRSKPSKNTMGKTSPICGQRGVRVCGNVCYIHG